MIQITENFRVNNDQTIKTAVAEFLVMQRNAGYVENDGRWTVSQSPELYWSAAGFLRRRRPGRFLGVFDTKGDAIAAMLAAEAMPIKDEMVR